MALFTGLSGTTWAVSHLPGRSVGSLELRRGAVRKENIANGTVTRSRLGKDLSSIARASSRSTRPSFRTDATYAVRAGYAENAGHADSAALADQATAADTATSATRADSVTFAPRVSGTDSLDGHDSSFFVEKGTILDIPRFSLGDDETRVMLSHGPFTVTARCFINQLASDDADVLISTTQTHAAFHGFTNNPDFNPNDPQSVRSLIGVDGPSGLPQFESSARATAVAADGTDIRSMVLYAGLNVFGQVGRCQFGGFAIL